jgi:hypothetical protein
MGDVLEGAVSAVGTDPAHTGDEAERVACPGCDGPARLIDDADGQELGCVGRCRGTWTASAALGVELVMVPGRGVLVAACAFVLACLRRGKIVDCAPLHEALGVRL